VSDRTGRWASLAFAVAWVAYFAVLQWSVVQYRVPIVAVLVACAIALAAWQVGAVRVVLSPPAVAVMLVGAAVVTMTVPLFTYLDPGALVVARTTLALAAVATAALLWSGRERPALVGAVVSVLAYVLAGVVAVTRDPAPEIDVWVTLQQASDALARGENIYEAIWQGSPGIQDAFTYLPFTAVLLAPGRWLFGDVRWALIGWTLVAALGVWALAMRSRAGQVRAGQARGDELGPRWRASAVMAGLLLAPGTLTQLDQAWTEPLLLAGLVWWAVLVDRGWGWWAVIPLALACASKQHLALLLPVLLVWRPFGARRTLATAAAAGLLIAPWFAAGPQAFFDDTVALLVTFHPILFANTLYLLALNTFGVTLPFWVTGLVVLGALAGITAVVRHRQPELPELLRWLALLLLIANLMNKQAFYNQYWLVGMLVLVSLAHPPGGAPDASEPPRAERVDDAPGRAARLG
jgi:hypothetical protein